MKEYDGRWFFDLGSNIERARGVHGDSEPDKARALLRYFCWCVEDDRVPDARVMHYLSIAFSEFLNQGTKGSIEKALGLKRRRAGNPGKSANRNKSSTRLSPDATEELRQEIESRLRSQETHAKIKRDLSAGFGVSEITVRDLIREIVRGEEGGEFHN